MCIGGREISRLLKRKGVKEISARCTVCKKWIHKWYSGVRGNLSLVLDGFRCK